MTETHTEEQARWRFRAFEETPEHYVARLTKDNPEAVPPPLPDPASIARTQLERAARQDGYVIDFDSVREDNRMPVKVPETMDDWWPADSDETPDGHLVTWSASGSLRVGTDADDPVIDCKIEQAGRQVSAVVPEPHATAGGSIRLRHNLGGDVTVLAYDADGEGMGYLFATTLDRDSVHVEFFGGTAKFVVTRDE